MTDPLDPLGRPGAATPLRSLRRAATGAAFDVSFAETTAPAAAETSATGSVGAVNPMLLHELAVDGEERRDREAHQHGTDVLELLAALQRGLLGAKVETLPMERLLSLVEHPPEAADPGLAAVTRAIVLRARIEIARRLPRAPAQD